MQPSAQQVEAIFQHYKEEGIHKLLFTKCRRYKNQQDIHSSIRKVTVFCFSKSFSSMEVKSYDNNVFFLYFYNYLL